MPNITYFAHSYRPRDVPVNEYIADLMQVEGFLPSLDPPSSRVNAAKLERHLNSSDCMVAVLNPRNDEVSPHVLFEISLAVRARKPVLVFIDDRLRDGLVPRWLPQIRFSSTSFLRQFREHRMALRALGGYLGQEATPRYLSAIGQRTCLILASLAGPVGTWLHAYVAESLGYQPVAPDSGYDRLHSPTWWGAVAMSDAVLVVSDRAELDLYAIAAARAMFRPMIWISGPGAQWEVDPCVPREYQASILLDLDPEVLRLELDAQFRIFQEDFLELDDKEEVARYGHLLMRLDGHYGPTTGSLAREVINVTGDINYVAGGQVGAVGRENEVHDNSFLQFQSALNDVDLSQLATELAGLRQAAKVAAVTADEDAAVGALAEAETAAKSGDKNALLGHLRRAGTWALAFAEKVGSALVTSVLKAALQLP
jgi:hypothetical protein